MPPNAPIRALVELPPTKIPERPSEMSREVGFGTAPSVGRPKSAAFAAASFLTVERSRCESHPSGLIPQSAPARSVRRALPTNVDRPRSIASTPRTIDGKQKDSRIILLSFCFCRFDLLSWLCIQNDDSQCFCLLVVFLPLFLVFCETLTGR